MTDLIDSARVDNEARLFPPDGRVQVGVLARRGIPVGKKNYGSGLLPTLAFTE